MGHDSSSLVKAGMDVVLQRQAWMQKVSTRLTCALTGTSLLRYGWLLGGIALLSVWGSGKAVNPSFCFSVAGDPYLLQYSTTHAHS